MTTQKIEDAHNSPHTAYMSYPSGTPKNNAPRKRRCPRITKASPLSRDCYLYPEFDACLGDYERLRLDLDLLERRVRADRLNKKKQRVQKRRNT